MNPAWLFVFATIIAEFGILYAFRKLMATVKTKIEDQTFSLQSIQKEQTRFFLGVAIAEAIPILLVVYGFMHIGQIEQVYNPLLPLLVIAAIFILTLVNVLSIRRDTIGYELADETKTSVTTLIFIGISLLSAIPIISVVAIFTMIS